MMKKFVKQGVIALVLTAALPAYQVFAADAGTKDPKITAIYTALAESKDKVKTITELAKADKADAALIASIAAAAGIAPEVVEAGIKAGNPSESTSAIAAAYNKGLNDVTAYTPATAAGPNAANQVAQGNNASNGGFSNSPGSSFSGGGGGSASHN
ncbi:hypothetical protein ACO0K2_01900 [Undibacterium sp. MH2W]|uniref:hypothetical protein n=1 Tax=Undibacterium sp. MH2W TaxID=3413044 RepID=UPI003BF188D3